MRTRPIQNEIPAPTNPLVCAALTDLYQITMAHAYFKNGMHETPAVFDLFFRQNPFGGEYAMLGGIEESLRYIANFRFGADDISYIKTLLPPSTDQNFFEYLKSVNGSRLSVYAMKEGTIVFPRLPLMRVEGPLAAAQLLETTLLNQIGFATLLTTKAARIRSLVGPKIQLMEFGLRRAQGADGGISASRYSYIGGFNATSNVLAGKLFGIPVKGTHAHSYVQAHSALKDLKTTLLCDKEGKNHSFVPMVLDIRESLGWQHTNESELAAFISYAQAFPDGFLALVDTYSTLKSGVPNFICVAIALSKLGYKPLGVRIDSGDLAYLSREIKSMFYTISNQYRVNLRDQIIVGSNEIDEDVIASFNAGGGHEIDSMGIGTKLAVCSKTPSLGVVYKLVEIDGKPRIKISEETGKITIPGKKNVYRLLNASFEPLADLMTLDREPAPKANEFSLCLHPFNGVKRARVKPTEVVPLMEKVWDRGKLVSAMPAISEIREYATDQVKRLREDHKRSLNPTPYKVSVSQKLYDFTHHLIAKESAVQEIS